MGFKRPFDSEDFQELPFKQTRFVDCSNKVTQFADLYKTTSQETDVTDNYVKFQQHAISDNSSVPVASNSVKEFEIDAPWSFVTSNFIDDNAGSCFPDFLAHSEFNVQGRLGASEDAFSSYLDSSPGKQVPLGPNHQASIPVCGMHVNKNWIEKEVTMDPSNSAVSNSYLNICNDDQKKLMSTCIIPMPDAEFSAGDEVGGGRRDCSCIDEGSVRCVQQHIREAKENLRKSIGDEKLANLGFYEMGEEVTSKWTKEEERVFHAVVNSNPASLGQNFWKHLSHVFSARSTREIVSYYFNVFMLRRRAAQNRSNLLDVDSDDDELHGINRGFYRAQVTEEDDDSDIESIDQYGQSGHGEDTLVEDDENNDDEEEEEVDDDNSATDGDLGGDSSGEATGEDSGIDNVSETHHTKSFDGSRFNAVKHFDKRAGVVGEDYTVQDDSCTSFEFQADTIDPCDRVNTEDALQGRRFQSNERECFPGNGNGYSNGVDQVYLLDSCDAKAWDNRYSIPVKGVDLLPTCNIIEEIFGLGTSGDK